MASDIEKIEITLAHQQQMLDDLNDIVTGQSKEIGTLKKKLAQAQDRVEALEMQNDATRQQEGETATEFAGRSKPPHY